MPTENSEKIRVSKVGSFFKSTVSNHSYLQGSVMNALTASHGPSESIAGSTNRPSDCIEGSGTKFKAFQGSWDPAP